MVEAAAGLQDKARQVRVERLLPQGGTSLRANHPSRLVPLHIIMSPSSFAVAWAIKITAHLAVQGSGGVETVCPAARVCAALKCR